MFPFNKWPLGLHPNGTTLLIRGQSLIAAANRLSRAVRWVTFAVRARRGRRCCGGRPAMSGSGQTVKAKVADLRAARKEFRPLGSKSGTEWVSLPCGGFHAAPGLTARRSGDDDGVRDEAGKETSTMVCPCRSSWHDGCRRSLGNPGGIGHGITLNAGKPPPRNIRRLVCRIIRP